MALSKSLKIGLGLLVALATVAEAAHDTLIGANSPAFVQSLWFEYLILAAIILALYILSLGVGTLRQEEQTGWSLSVWLTIGVGLVTAIGLFAFFIAFVILFVIRNDTGGHTPPGSDTETSINAAFISGVIYMLLYPFVIPFLTSAFLRGSVHPVLYGAVTGIHWVVLLIAFILAIPVDTLVWVLLLIATVALAVNGIILLIWRSDWWSGTMGSKQSLMPSAVAQHFNNLFGQVPMPTGYAYNPQYPHGKAV